MSTLYLLLLLTQNSAGDINASFVNSKSLAECEQSMLMVQGIFTSRDIPLLYRGCMVSPLRFSPFNHSNTSNVTRYHYLITVEGEKFAIESLQNRDECMGRGSRGATEQVYCASSTQHMLK